MFGVAADRSGPSPRRLLILIAVTALVLMTLDARDAPGLDGARRVAGTVFSPIRGLVGWVGDPIVDAWQGALHFDDLEDENRRLRAELAEARGDLARFPDLEAELDELRTATAVPFAAEIPRLTARVSDDRRTGFERIVEIELGDASTVTAGNPVVTGDGLVGRVELVVGDRAVVRLLSDPRAGVGVTSRGAGLTGVATGVGDGQPLTLEFLVDADADPIEAQRYVTTGRDGSQYPADLPVGTIVFDDDGDPALEPLADLADLGYVTVLLWLPEEAAPVEAVADEEADS